MIDRMFPSPHSGILFLLFHKIYLYIKRRSVSVPSFGDSFFINVRILLIPHIHRSFRPLIRGFFFYANKCRRVNVRWQRVSVPSFGDSFFMWGYWSLSLMQKTAFPSPHSGILFL